jgi:hypothetical protein
MKKLSLFLLVGLISLTGFSQRFKATTFTANPINYKKHFSHSIEGGIANNQLRQFVTGNKTDWGYYNKEVTGHPIDGVNFLPGRKANLDIGDERIQVTDFTIYPTDNYQYGAGTGVYYPNGSGGMGYPFFAKYDKVTMQINDVWYYNISYPGIQELANAVGLRIKYSHVERAFYISGVMADRLFDDVNMNNIHGKSKGFILKIDDTGMANPQVLIFEPDNLPGAPYDPILCVVTDLEISADESEIAFTGMTTKETGFNGYYHPMVGIIDMDLNVQWSNVYNFPATRYSGIGVEYNTTDDKLLVLLNSARYPFAMMELDYNGLITQQPVSYVFDAPFVVSESARAHKMHYANGEIIITGNCFVEDNSQPQTIEKQLLFSYEIPNATNLLAGNNYFESYSTEVVPLGSQKAVTGYWAPENSIYQDENLSIVGIYNNNNQSFGYTLIQVNGLVNDPGCIETGEVSITGFTSEKDDQATSLDDCRGIDFDVLNEEDLPNPIQDCPTVGSKSATALGNGIAGNGNFWYFKGIDAQGIHAVLVSENSNTVYEVDVYDVVGRKVFTSTYNVSEVQSEIYLDFATKAEMYIISVSNGSQTETLKVIGNR